MFLNLVIVTNKLERFYSTY